jgi:hypothetical protein
LPNLRRVGRQEHLLVNVIELGNRGRAKHTLLYSGIFL